MKIELEHSGIIIGEIFSTIASRETKELKGLLMPTKYYFEIRSQIIKYNQIFHNPKAKNIIDRFLDKTLERKYSNLNNWFRDFLITADAKPITGANTEIRIVDNLTKTGLGNIEIFIQAWNLDTENVSQEFKIYSIEYAYPTKPNNIIEIRYNKEILFKI